MLFPYLVFWYIPKSQKILFWYFSLEEDENNYIEIYHRIDLNRLFGKGS